MRILNKRIWLLGIILPAVLLSGCAEGLSGLEEQPIGVGESGVVNNQNAEPIAENSDELTAPTEIETNPQPTEQLPLEVASLPQATEVEQPDYELGFSLGDVNLRATNPSGVQINSGKPQLIEFFAFW